MGGGGEHNKSQALGGIIVKQIDTMHDSQWKCREPHPLPSQKMAGSLKEKILLASAN